MNLPTHTTTALAFGAIVLVTTYRLAYSTGYRNGTMCIARVPADLGLGVLCAVAALVMLFLGRVDAACTFFAASLGSLAHYTAYLGTSDGFRRRTREEKADATNVIARTLRDGGEIAEEHLDGFDNFVMREATWKELGALGHTFFGDAALMDEEGLLDLKKLPENDDGMLDLRAMDRVRRAIALHARYLNDANAARLDADPSNMMNKLD